MEVGRLFQNMYLLVRSTEMKEDNRLSIYRRPKTNTGKSWPFNNADPTISQKSPRIRTHGRKTGLSPSGDLRRQSLRYWCHICMWIVCPSPRDTLFQVLATSRASGVTGKTWLPFQKRPLLDHDDPGHDPVARTLLKGGGNSTR